MENEQKAKIFLEEFYKNRPKEILQMLDDNSKGMYVILQLLARSNKKILSGDISKALGFSTPRVAVALNTLEKKGLVKRSAFKTDARKTVVDITEQGKTALEKREAELVKFVTKLINAVGEDELNEFLRIAVKMNDALKRGR